MDFVEKLGVKDKKSLVENGCSLVKNDSAVFHDQISTQNQEAAISHPMGELRLEFNAYKIINLLDFLAVN